MSKNFSEYSKSTREKLYSKLKEEKNLRKVAELLCIFLTALDEVENMLRLCNQILLINICITITLRIQELRCHLI